VSACVKWRLASCLRTCDFGVVVWRVFIHVNAAFPPQAQRPASAYRPTCRMSLLLGQDAVHGHTLGLSRRKLSLLLGQEAGDTLALFFALSICVLLIVAVAVCACACFCPRRLMAGKKPRSKKKSKKKPSRSRETSRLKPAPRHYRKVQTAIAIDDLSSASADEHVDRLPRPNRRGEAPSPPRRPPEAVSATFPRSASAGLPARREIARRDSIVPVLSKPPAASPPPPAPAPLAVQTLADISGPLDLLQPQSQPSGSVGYAHGDDLTMVALARLPARSNYRADV